MLTAFLGVALFGAISLFGAVSTAVLGAESGRAAPRSDSSQAAPLSTEAATKLARQLLASDDREEREQLREQLAVYLGPIEPVIEALRSRTHSPVKPGYHSADPFRTPELRKAHPDERLYFVVPKGYEPTRPTGLIVFLHGGGIDTAHDAPAYTLLSPEEDTPTDSSRSGDMLAATGMITVGPSAPGEGESYYRWCLGETDDYLADVITECKNRFNIDDDRVFLLGHSMGGFGAYHHALRQPDRFAAVIVSSGSWTQGYWPVIRGTPLCIVQGTNDAQRGVRWHHTDIQHARFTHEILSREKLDHRYIEHDGEHGISENRQAISEYFAEAKALRRDPYYPHIAIASPLGFMRDFRSTVSDNRWLTLDEATEGTLTYDELVSNGSEDFDDWRLAHRRRKRTGAMVDAIIGKKNTIGVTTQNVARFTLWLHPAMVDVGKPVIVNVDGEERFREMVEPSLVTALESYERRHDWGLIYPIKIELKLQE